MAVTLVSNNCFAATRPKLFYCLRLPSILMIGEVTQKYGSDFCMPWMEEKHKSLSNYLFLFFATYSQLPNKSSSFLSLNSLKIFRAQYTSINLYVHYALITAFSKKQSLVHTEQYIFVYYTLNRVVGPFRAQYT